MNWTLSDNKSRLVIKVGVAYGTDTTLVQNTLYKVANRYPLIVSDPAPQVVFSGFGDSTLDFELRVVIPNRNIFVKVTHELHMAVEEAFRQKKIEIAFPQLDLYVKNLGDLRTPVPPFSSDSDNSPKAATGSGNFSGTMSGPRAQTHMSENTPAKPFKNAS